MTDIVGHGNVRTPQVRRIDLDQPWRWLAAGWHDLRMAPGISLLYGAVYAVIGCALTTWFWLEGILYVSLPLAATFTLIGPIAAVGLYQVSRDLETEGRADLGRSLTAFKANPGQIAFMGVVLLLFALAWMRLAFLLFMLFFGHSPMAPDALHMVDTFLAPENLPFLILGSAIGAVLAGLVFAISVVSIPLLLDHTEANVITAIAASFEAVRQNFWPMLLWAWLIAMFIAAGCVTLYLGLIIFLPMIGHATWHAYKDLIAWE